MFLCVRHSLGLIEVELKNVQSGFPFGVLQALFLFVIFYLTVNLYHRSRYVLRNYAYLGLLEKEIREQLPLPDSSVGFTRESSFYWGQRDAFAPWVKVAYVRLISGVLVAFLLATIYGDLKSGNCPLTVTDILFALPIGIFLYATASSSIQLDKEGAVTPADGRGKDG